MTLLIHMSDDTEKTFCNVVRFAVDNVDPEPFYTIAYKIDHGTETETIPCDLVSGFVLY
jgi:hypothetical protein